MNPDPVNAELNMDSNLEFGTDTYWYKDQLDPDP